MPSSTTHRMEPTEQAPDGVSQASTEGAEAPPAEAVDVLLHDNYSEYLLHGPREILSVLRQVVDQGDLVTVYFNSGKDFLLTTLLAVNEEEVLLDYGSNVAMNKRALEAGKVFCITRHDKVKLQFILSSVREAEHEGRNVFAADLPQSLLRLQRRAYFRLRTPISRPLLCNIPLVYSDGSVVIRDHIVIDISLGGLSLQMDDLPFAIDQEFVDCTLDLPQIGVIVTTIKVLNSYDIPLRSGQHSQRAGCQFVDLPTSSQNLIQRYIVGMERERKARESGLA